MNGNLQHSAAELPEALMSGEVERVLVVFGKGGWTLHPVHAGQCSEYPIVTGSGRPFRRRTLDGTWAFLRRCGVKEMEIHRQRP